MSAFRWTPWIALGVMMALWPGRAYGRRGVDGNWMEALEPGRGRAAAKPQDIPAKGWRDILLRTYKEITSDDIPRVAGGVTFFGLLALFPGLAAFVALYGLFFDVAEAQKQVLALSGVVPPGAAKLIGEQMLRLAGEHRANLSFAFIVSLLLSFWSANAGMKAMMHGLNIAYDEAEKRGFVKLTLTSLAFTVGMIALLTVAAAGVVAVPLVLSLLNIDAGALALLRWPLLLVGMIVALAVLYRYGPSRERARWRWVTPGSVAAAVTWLAGSAAFSLYLSKFAHYDRTYGTFGALFGAMMWLWMSSIIIFAGAELNGEIEHQTAVDSTTGKPAPIGSRGAVMADTIGEKA